MRKTILGLALGAALLVQACSGNGGFTELESGYAYKLVDNQEGNSAEEGDFMMIDLKSVFGEDSLLIERYAADGFGLDPLRGTPENLKEILALCDEGDSVHVKMSLMEYARLTRMPISRGMDTTKSVVMQMRIVEVDNEASIIEKKKKKKKKKN